MANVTQRQNTDIVRYAGDTYPTKIELTLNGIAMNLDGWSVICRVEVPLRNADGVIVNVLQIIDCVITDSSLGKVSLYPNARYMSLEEYAVEAVTVVANTDAGMDNLISATGITNQDAVGAYNAGYTSVVLSEQDHVSDDMAFISGNTYKSNQCWANRELLGGEGVQYNYSLVREKSFDLGDTVDYKEVMTCLTGTVTLKKRV